MMTPRSFFDHFTHAYGIVQRVDCTPCTHVHARSLPRPELLLIRSSIKSVSNDFHRLMLNKANNYKTATIRRSKGKLPNLCVRQDAIIVLAVADNLTNGSRIHPNAATTTSGSFRRHQECLVC